MKNKQVVVIKEMAAGNETIGEAWKETKIFNSDQPISDVLEWAFGNGNASVGTGGSYTIRRNVIITIAD